MCRSSINIIIQIGDKYGIQWPWAQIPLRRTFYSYFKESVSGEYHIYIYIYIYVVVIYKYISGHE